MGETIVMNRAVVPEPEQIEEFLTPSAAALWNALLADAQERYGAKWELSYSVCSGKPGWNVKLRAKGRPLCVLYPDPGWFTALVVLNEAACETFSLLRDSFCEATRALVDRTRLFNGTKWLMAEVRDEGSLRDVQHLMALRVESARTK